MFCKPAIQWTLIFLLAVACGGRNVIAADSKSDRAAKLKAITADYERQAADFMKAFEAANSDAERKQAEKRRPSDAQFGKKVLALAKDSPSDATAFDGFVWIIDNLAFEDSAVVVDESIALFEKHHLNSPRLRVALRPLADCDSPKAEKLLEKVGEKSDSRDVRGVAQFRLALGRYGRAIEKNDEPQLEQIAKLLERTQKEYGDIQPDDEDEPISTLAGPVLFEIRHLRPGKEIPEIVGTDLAGKPLKLSSFRGKVVLLVFWGSWCGPCMAQVPSERKLMDKYSGKPFTIVGVNCNDSREKAAAAAKQQKMAWPSFLDGEDGPVATEWHIEKFPSMLLIDSRGIIVMKDPPNEEELDSQIADAVKKAAAK